MTENTNELHEKFEKELALIYSDQKSDVEEEIALLKEQEKYYKTDSEEQYLKHTGSTHTEGNQKNIFAEFVKQLSSGIELYRISVPTFILQPVSLLEKLSSYAQPNSTLDSLTQETDPEQRFLKVLAWALSTWHSIPRKGIEASKPYNPIIGEQFFCEWKHKDGSVTKFVAEQVVHHPPISAFYTINEERGFVYHGWVEPRTGFHLNSVSATMDEGEFHIDLLKTGEHFVLKQPPVNCSGIIWGTQQIEIYDQLVLTCSKIKRHAVIDFIQGGDGKLEGYVYGKDLDDKLYKIEGVVNKTVFITNLKTNEKKEFYDVAKVAAPAKIVTPVAEQKLIESRRNWHKVTVLLREEKYEEAQLEKHLIEERQRYHRKLLKEKNEEFKPKLFHKVGKSWVYNESAVKRKQKKQKKQEEKSWGSYLTSWIW